MVIIVLIYMIMMNKVTATSPPQCTEDSPPLTLCYLSPLFTFFPIAY